MKSRRTAGEDSQADADLPVCLEVISDITIGIPSVGGRSGGEGDAAAVRGRIKKVTFANRAKAWVLVRRKQHGANKHPASQGSTREYSEICTLN